MLRGFQNISDWMTKIEPTEIDIIDFTKLRAHLQKDPEYVRERAKLAE
jgi:hypothetical protein